jgi:hypothetical protein
MSIEDQASLPILEMKQKVRNSGETEVEIC